MKCDTKKSSMRYSLASQFYYYTRKKKRNTSVIWRVLESESKSISKWNRLDSRPLMSITKWIEGNECSHFNVSLSVCLYHLVLIIMHMNAHTAHTYSVKVFLNRLTSDYYVLWSTFITNFDIYRFQSLKTNKRQKAAFGLQAEKYSKDQNHIKIKQT